MKKCSKDQPICSAVEIGRIQLKKCNEIAFSSGLITEKERNQMELAIDSWSGFQYVPPQISKKAV